MKKIIYCLILVFLRLNVYSAELWLGFTEGMTVAEVKKRVPLIVTDPKFYEDKDSGDIYQWDGPIGWEMPYTSCLAVSTKNDFFMQKTSYGWSADRQMIFYFRDNKLYHIQVLFNLYGNDILKNLTKTYGQPTTTIPHRHQDGTVEYEYLWQFEGKTVRFNNPYNCIINLDDRAYVNYYNEVNKINYDKKINEQKEKEEKLKQDKYKQRESQIPF